MADASSALLDDIAEYCNTLCLTVLGSSEQNSLLLRQMHARWLHGEVMATDDILALFSAQSGARQDDSGGRAASEKAKRLARRRKANLKAALEKHYGKTGAKVPIRFAVSRTAFKVFVNGALVQPKGDLTTPAAPKYPFPRVDCFFIGDDAAAIGYEVTQMPHLASLRDTHIRGKPGHKQYKKVTLDPFSNALRAFLKRDRSNRLTVISGNLVEDKYARRLAAAARARSAQVEWYFVHRSAPLMNFALLEYADGNRPTEVLFGWGRQGWDHAEGVFLSPDEQLVGEFVRFFDALKSEAELIPNAAVPQRILSRLKRRDGILSEAAFVELERSTRRGREIWVATPTLENVTDANAVFRQVVTDNAAKGISYRYMYPRHRPGTEREEVLKACFTGRTGRLRVYAVKDDDYIRHLRLATTFVAFEPRASQPDVYMQLPTSGKEGGWLRLHNARSARSIVAAMRALMQISAPRNRRAPPRAPRGHR